MNSLKINDRKVNIFSSDAELIDYVADRQQILVAINAEKIANRTPQLKDIINRNIGYLDGIGPVMAVRRRGLHQACKIPGCELWLKIVERFRHSRSFYLLGASPAVIDDVVRRLTADFPGISIAGYHDGYLTTDAVKQTVIDDIVSKKPDIVFVAMGSPRQELLMDELLALHPALYMGLGGSFDVYTGRVKRAPKWWLDHNLEFAYRLIRQPKRIRRQLNSLRFLWMLITNKL